MITFTVTDGTSDVEIYATSPSEAGEIAASSKGLFPRGVTLWVKKCPYWHQVEGAVADALFDGGEFSREFHDSTLEKYSPCGKCSSCNEAAVYDEAMAMCED